MSQKIPAQLTELSRSSESKTIIEKLTALFKFNTFPVYFAIFITLKMASCCYTCIEYDIINDHTMIYNTKLPCSKVQKKTATNIAIFKHETLLNHAIPS